MTGRTGEKPSDGFVRAAFENQRSGVARRAERLSGEPDDDDLKGMLRDGFMNRADASLLAARSADLRMRSNAVA
jgi:hypothetical protein